MIRKTSIALLLALTFALPKAHVCALVGPPPESAGPSAPPSCHTPGASSEERADPDRTAGARDGCALSCVMACHTAAILSAVGIEGPIEPATALAEGRMPALVPPVAQTIDHVPLA